MYTYGVKSSLSVVSWIRSMQCIQEGFLIPYSPPPSWSWISGPATYLGPCCFEGNILLTRPYFLIYFFSLNADTFCGCFKYFLNLSFYPQPQFHCQRSGFHHLLPEYYEALLSMFFSPVLLLVSPSFILHWMFNLKSWSHYVLFLFSVHPHCPETKSNFSTWLIPFTIPTRYTLLFKVPLAF